MAALLAINIGSLNTSASKRAGGRRAVVEAARTVEIRVLDHIIVGKNGYFSFQESGLLPG